MFAVIVKASSNNSTNDKRSQADCRASIDPFVLAISSCALATQTFIAVVADDTDAALGNIDLDMIKRND